MQPNAYFSTWQKSNNTFPDTKSSTATINHWFPPSSQSGYLGKLNKKNKKSIQTEPSPNHSCKTMNYDAFKHPNNFNHDTESTLCPVPHLCGHSKLLHTYQAEVYFQWSLLQWSPSGYRKMSLPIFSQHGLQHFPVTPLRHRVVKPTIKRYVHPAPLHACLHPCMQAQQTLHHSAFHTKEK